MPPPKVYDVPSPAPIAAPTKQAIVDPSERPLDVWLLGAIVFLLCIGTIEIYSTTAAAALQSPASASSGFLKKQIVYLALGCAAMWGTTRIDLRLLRQLGPYMLLGALVLLLGVLAMPPINGARRWLLLGPLSFQPVEFAKLALVAYLAGSLARKSTRVHLFTIGFVPHLVVCGIVVALLLKQPDLGSSLVIGATTLTLMAIAGARISYITMAVLGAAPLVYQLVVGTPWRMQRVLAFFNPEAFASAEAYQIMQAHIALGSGGFFGGGIGESNQALGYLPEAHNDFILAPIGEELGWFGVAAVILAFGVVLVRGARAAIAARNPFACYLAMGITLLFTFQALLNMAVVLGVVPNKGITLPFVSYGGSSLILTMALGGLLLNVGRRHEPARARELVNAGPRRQSRVRVLTS